MRLDGVSTRGYKGCRMSWPLRRKLRLVWWVLCTATLCALPFMIWEFRESGYSTHYQAWLVAGIFAVMAMFVSFYEVAMHLEYWSKPELQLHVIRILLMVPIFSIDSWFSLKFLNARFYLTPVRECYEAFVVYSFYRYLIIFLETTQGNVAEVLARKPQQPHPWPLRMIVRPWTMGHKYFWECKKGIMNYVVARPLTTVVALVSEQYGVYGEQHLSFRNAWTYCNLINNVSQAWAIYCLVMFALPLHDELKPLHPLYKFITIKMVVFFSFWQGFVISVLAALGVLRAKESWTTYTTKDLTGGLQDFMVCIESFFFALAFAYAFPPRDYMTEEPKGFLNNVWQMFDIRDVVADVTDVGYEHVQDATTSIAQAGLSTIEGVGHVARVPHTVFKSITAGLWQRSGQGAVGPADNDSDGEGQQLSLLEHHEHSDRDPGVGLRDAEVASAIAVRPGLHPRTQSPDNLHSSPRDIP